MVQQQLSTLTVNDTSFNGYLLIRSISYGVTKTNRPFTNLILMDPSGTVSAKIWNTGEEDFPHNSGEIIQLNATVDFYRDEAQLVITNFTGLTTDDPHNRIGYYLQAAPMSLKKMRNVVNETINSIENPLYKNIAMSFIEKQPNGNKFEEHPAAKAMHHAYFRGLMYHTVRMLLQARGLLDVYTELDIDKDLLYTGILIHDLGKLEELSGYLDTEYTPNGTLLTHIGIVDGWLVQYAMESGLDINDPELVLLRHMVLSHHGQLQYGSPTQPHIPEAELLHRIDDTDARMTMFEDTLKNVSDNKLSKRVFGLDNRTLYKRPAREGHDNE